DLPAAGRGRPADAQPRPLACDRRHRPGDHAELGAVPELGDAMTRPEPQRGFVLLLVLVAAAVLSIIAAFIYRRTEDQLLMSVAARGQSLAAARATLAAERKLAIYRAAYPGGLTILTPAASYDTAADAGYVADREFQNLDKTTWPALELSNGGGANW